MMSLTILICHRTTGSTKMLMVISSGLHRFLLIKDSKFDKLLKLDKCYKITDQLNKILIKGQWISSPWKEESTGYITNYLTKMFKLERFPFNYVIIQLCPLYVLMHNNDDLQSLFSILYDKYSYMIQGVTWIWCFFFNFAYIIKFSTQD